MITLEITGITIAVLEDFLSSMRELWNSNRIYGRMHGPIYQTSLNETVWIYVYGIGKTWWRGISNLILKVEIDEMNDSCVIHISGKSIANSPNAKLEKEAEEFIEKRLRLIQSKNINMS